MTEGLPAEPGHEIEIAGRRIGGDHPTYVIAEISANHHHRFERAVELVEAAAEAGADAVKLQTYTPDTMTLDSGQEPFVVGEGTLWAGRRLYDLYREAMTPWDWHAPLRDVATAAGVHLFSSPFDASAVDFLDELGVPAYKIASFEVVDLPLIAYAAGKGRPLIVSTGMAAAEEVDAAVAAARDGGAPGVALLRCNSSYPASPEEMDLRTIPDMARRWGVPIGLSDHTMGVASAVAAVALGARLIEKHIIMTRSEPGPDSAFSLEPHEFAAMVAAVREAESALGGVRYGPSAHERASLAFRRSLFVVADVEAGEALTPENVRAIRPGPGLPPGRLGEVLGRRAKGRIERGTPMAWDLLQD